MTKSRADAQYSFKFFFRKIFESKKLVNPVIAVLLGVIFAGEHVTLIQVIGLVVILSSVLLINLSKYRKAKHGELAVAK